MAASVEVSSNVRQARIEKGYSQEELAKFAGVTQQQISHIERGVKAPSLPVALKISELLGKDMRALFFG